MKKLLTISLLILSSLLFVSCNKSKSYEYPIYAFDTVVTLVFYEDNQEEHYKNIKNKIKDAVKNENKEFIMSVIPIYDYFIEEAGEKEDPGACQYLMSLYDGSLELVEPDIDKAIYYAKKCAEKGDTYLQISLGLLYYPNKDLRPDKQKYTYWLKKAAYAGNSAGQYFYSAIFRDSNPKECLAWLEKSAQQGYEDAMLTGMYELMSREQFSDAIAWYNRWKDKVSHNPIRIEMKIFAADAYGMVENYKECFARLQEIVDSDYETLYQLHQDILCKFVRVAIIFCADNANCSITNRTYLRKYVNQILSLLRDNGNPEGYYWSGIAEWYGAFGPQDKKLAQIYMTKAAQLGDEDSMRFCIVNGWKYEL